MNIHTATVLIIFIVCIIMLCFRWLDSERFSPKCVITKPRDRGVFSEIFNIDTHLVEEPSNLGWKHFWRTNVSQFSPELTNLYRDSDLKILPPLLFDGIRDVNNCPPQRKLV
jgi:hypothetical protein